MKKLKNSLFYSYIQMAYEFVRELGQPQMEGDRGEFIASLYRSRMESILENKDKGKDLSLSLGELAAWGNHVYQQNEVRLVEGDLKEFENESNSYETWLELLSQYAQSFTEDLTNTDGPLLKFGTDAYATYMPIHFFFEPDKPLDTHWGIYISETGMAKVAAELKTAFENDAYFGTIDEKKKNRFFLAAAYQILLRHEMLHFRIESFALNAELILKQPLYVPYLIDVYANQYKTKDCLEEALANATVLDSVVIRDLFKKIYTGRDSKRWQTIVSRRIFDRQPDGYNNYHLLMSDDTLWEGRYTNRSYSSAWNSVSRSKSPQRQLAMNYLCNQILSTACTPESDFAPFFAFFPDNYFLRSENLVPIHVVTTLSPENSFIRQAPPKMRDWKRFMRDLGYRPTNRGNGDHVAWVKPGLPNLTINSRRDEIDFNSFKSSLNDLGITRHDFEKYQLTGRLPEPLRNRI